MLPSAASSRRQKRPPLWAASRAARLLAALLALFGYMLVPQGFMPMASAAGTVRIMPCPEQGGWLPMGHTMDGAMPGMDETVASAHDTNGAATAPMPGMDADHQTGEPSKSAKAGKGPCSFANHASFAAPPPITSGSIAPILVPSDPTPPLSRGALPARHAPRPPGQGPPFTETPPSV